MAIIIMDELDEEPGTEQETPGTTERAVALLEEQGHDVRVVAGWEQRSYVAARTLGGAHPDETVWLSSEHYLGHHHEIATNGECADAICTAVTRAIEKARDETA